MKKLKKKMCPPLSVLAVLGLLALGVQALAETTAPATVDSTTASDAGPKAVYPQMQWEFTPVLEGAEITHDFFIENHGDAPLVIESVRPD